MRKIAPYLVVLGLIVVFGAVGYLERVPTANIGWGVVAALIGLLIITIGGTKLMAEGSIRNRRRW